jgi:hypothetical protein
MPYQTPGKTGGCKKFAPEMAREKFRRRRLLFIPIIFLFIFSRRFEMLCPSNDPYEI